MASLQRVLIVIDLRPSPPPCHPGSSGPSPTRPAAAAAVPSWTRTRARVPGRRVVSAPDGRSASKRRFADGRQDGAGQAVAPRHPRLRHEASPPLEKRPAPSPPSCPASTFLETSYGSGSRYQECLAVDPFRGFGRGLVLPHHGLLWRCFACSSIALFVAACPGGATCSKQPPSRRLYGFSPRRPCSMPAAATRAHLLPAGTAGLDCLQPRVEMRPPSLLLPRVARHGWPAKSCMNRTANSNKACTSTCASWARHHLRAC